MSFRIRLRTYLLCIIVPLLLSNAVIAKKDLYKTLGVNKGCSANELKKAYRKAALKHHPDKAPADQREKAEKKFKEVNHAYEILGDEEKRASYDQFGEAALDPQFSPSPFSSSSFSSGQSRSSSRRQHQGEMPDFFSFFQQQQGGQTGGMPQSSFSSFGNSFSSSSTGAGGIDLQEMLRKMMGGPNLGGGMPRQKPRPPKQESYTRNIACTLEELATGSTKRLRVTHPTEERVFEEFYTIELKPGWKAGTKIKFPARHDGYFPAMTFVVNEKPHAYLKRQGNDLLYKCEITKRQAERGVKIKIPLPTGETVEVKEEGPMEDGYVKTVVNKGMPIRGGPRRGNLKIEFKVIESSRHA